MLDTSVISARKTPALVAENIAVLSMRVFSPRLCFFVELSIKSDRRAEGIRHSGLVEESLVASSTHVERHVFNQRSLGKLETTGRVDPSVPLDDHEQQITLAGFGKGDF